MLLFFVIRSLYHLALALLRAENPSSGTGTDAAWQRPRRPGKVSDGDLCEGRERRAQRPRTLRAFPHLT